MTGRSTDSTGKIDTRRWGFIGAGRMATALVRGMVRGGIAPASAICASDPLAGARTALATEAGISVFDSNRDVVRAQ